MRLRLAAARRGPAAGLGPAVEDTISRPGGGDRRAAVADRRALARSRSRSWAWRRRSRASPTTPSLRTASTSPSTSREWRDARGPIRLEPELESTLYRAAQEALANVTAHAGAATVELRLRRTAAEVEVRVTDDGRGFEPGAPVGALGLIVLAERLSLVEGRLAVESAPGGGTTLSARVPV